jgi:Flp pilus assembly protein TadG
LLSLEHRFGRMANALEMAAKAATVGANNIEGLTAQVNRLADAFEAMAGFIGCVTESVEGVDGVSRCYVRTRDDNHGWLLSQTDDREGD